MGGLVNALWFEINADPAKAREALEGFKGTVENLVSAMEGNFNSLGSQLEGIVERTLGPWGLLVGGVAALGGALVGLGEKAAYTAEAINNVAQRTGLTVENVSTLRAVAADAGVSFDVVSRAMTMFVRSVEGAAGPSKAARAALKDLGITLTDNHGKLKDANVLIPELLAKLAAMDPTGRRTADMMGIFGKQAGQLVPMLAFLKEGFEKAKQEAAALGLVFTEKDVVAGEQLLISQRFIKDALEGIATEIGRKVIPSLISLTEMALTAGDRWDIFRLQIKLAMPEIAAVGAAIMGLAHSLMALRNLAEGDILGSAREAKEAKKEFAGIAEEMKKIPAISHELSRAEQKLGEDTKNVAAHIAKLAAAMAFHRINTEGLTDKTKQYADRLAELRDKQIAVAESMKEQDTKVREALKTYKDFILEVDKAIETEQRQGRLTTKMVQEGNQAKKLAYENYQKHVSEILKKEHEELAKVTEETKRTALEVAAHFTEHAVKIAAAAETEEQKIHRLRDEFRNLSYGAEALGKVISLTKEELDKLNKTTEGAEKYAKDLQTIMRADPAVIAAIQREYGKLTPIQIMNKKALMDLVAQYSHGAGLVDKFTASLNRTEQRLQKLDKLMPDMTAKFRGAFGGMSEAHQKFVELFVEGETKIVGSIDQSLLAYGFSQKAMQQIYQSMLRDLGQMLAHEAHLQAMKQIAHAVSDLAKENYSGAAKHFAAAAAWEALGAGVSGLMGTLAGGGSSSVGPRSAGRNSESGSGSSLPSRPTGMAAGSSGRPGGNLTVMVTGDAGAAKWMVGLINKAVNTQDVHLTATRVKQPPYASRG